MTSFSLLVILLGWLCLGLEAGLRGVTSISIGPAQAAPSFVIPLAVFICICAQPAPALWSALALGAAVDITWQRPAASEPITVLGPNALGFLVAAQLILAVRGLVIRRNPLTAAALSVPAAAIVHIVVAAILTARHLWDPALVWQGTAQLGADMLSAVLTFPAGLVLGVLLMPLAPALGMGGSPGRHSLRRSL